jgi:hypothetical protein
MSNEVMTLDQIRQLMHGPVFESDKYRVIEAIDALLAQAVEVVGDDPVVISRAGTDNRSTDGWLWRVSLRNVVITNGMAKEKADTIANNLRVALKCGKYAPDSGNAVALAHPRPACNKCRGTGRYWDDIGTGHGGSWIDCPDCKALAHPRPAVEQAGEVVYESRRDDLDGRWTEIPEELYIALNGTTGWLVRKMYTVQPRPMGGVPDGYKLVPIEPATVMSVAAAIYVDKVGQDKATVNGIYRAMLAAAPEVQL